MSVDTIYVSINTFFCKVSFIAHSIESFEEVIIDFIWWIRYQQSLFIWTELSKFIYWISFYFLRFLYCSRCIQCISDNSFKYFFVILYFHLRLIHYSWDNLLVRYLWQLSIQMYTHSVFTFRDYSVPPIFDLWVYLIIYMFHQQYLDHWEWTDKYHQYIFYWIIFLNSSIFICHSWGVFSRLFFALSTWGVSCNRGLETIPILSGQDSG